jgi:hypothetical protein
VVYQHSHPGFTVLAKFAGIRSQLAPHFPWQ